MPGGCGMSDGKSCPWHRETLHGTGQGWGLDLCLSLKQLFLLPLTLSSWCSQHPKSLWGEILVCLEPHEVLLSAGCVCHSSGHFAGLLHLRQPQTLIPGFSDGM